MIESLLPRHERRCRYPGRKRIDDHKTLQGVLCAAGWVTGGRSPRLRLEEAGVISGYRARVDAEAAGRAFEVVVAVEIGVNDLQTVERLESLLASYDEVIECRRLFGRPDYFIRVAVADHAAYETFLTTKLIGLPAVIRVDSHLIMKKIKGDD